MNDTPVEKKVRTKPKWETDAIERLKVSIKKFAKPLADLCERDANEGDTRLIVTDFLCDGLGYDKYTELTTEYRVKGEFADFGIRLDQQMVAFIEVKRVNTKLGEKQLRQVQNYALNEGVEWVLLTNGHDWQIYRITLGLPVETHLVFQADLLSDQNIAQKATAFFLFTREAIKRGLIDEMWLNRRATSPKALKEILCSAPVLDVLRKEIKKKTGQTVDNTQLLGLLESTVIRTDCTQ
ncbi:MAG: type I restriction enzyme HsdR N-terminal domain-containing protein [Pyrinomonadaceae bacterium]